MHRPNFEWEIEEFTLNLLQPNGLRITSVVQQQCSAHTGGIVGVRVTSCG